MRALLLTLTACATTPLVFEFEDRDDINRGGSYHVIGPAVPGMVADVVWCAEDDSATGFGCLDRLWWYDDDAAMSSCVPVGEGEDRGLLWAWVWR